MFDSKLFIYHSRAVAEMIAMIKEVVRRGSLFDTIFDKSTARESATAPSHPIPFHLLKPMIKAEIDNIFNTGQQSCNQKSFLSKAFDSKKKKFRESWKNLETT